MDISYIQKISQESSDALQSIENEEELVDHLKEISDLISKHQTDFADGSEDLEHEINILIDKIKIKGMEPNLESRVNNTLQSVFDTQTILLNNMNERLSDETSEYNELSSDKISELEEKLEEMAGIAQILRNRSSELDETVNKIKILTEIEEKTERLVEISSDLNSKIEDSNLNYEPNQEALDIAAGINEVIGQGNVKNRTKEE